MESNVLTAVALPLALFIVMLGLGLSLTLEDFRRVVVYPKAVLVGLACQTLLLPAACFGIVKLAGLSPELGVGLMLLAASPGGPTANLYSHLAKGDVALNVTLTAVNSVLSLFTLPLIVNAAMVALVGEGKMVPLQLAEVAKVFAIVLVPVTVGMLVKRFAPGFAKQAGGAVKVLSALVLFLVIAGVVLKEKANLASYFQQVGLAALAFNLVSLLVGYLVPRLVKLDERQAIAIGMEVGIHNGTLAIAVASLMAAGGASTMAIPAAIYSLIMFFTAGAFGALVSRRVTGVVAPAAAATP